MLENTATTAPATPPMIPNDNATAALVASPVKANEPANTATPGLVALPIKANDQASNAIPAAADSTIKAGPKTTEFWLSTAAIVVSSLLASGLLRNETTLQIIGLVSTVLTALGYTAARTVVKSTAKPAAAP
jgi:hypothetical protein